MKIALYTIVSLLAFAGNSILCRLALGSGKIDAASFTSIRLFAGTVFLLVIFKLSNQNERPVSKGSWRAALMLFVYAIAFSYAYIVLETGTGALILFASVQLTIILCSQFSGHKIRLLESIGVAIAFAGVVYLVLPTLSTPSVSSFILMAMAGSAWGFYTIFGKASKNPLSDTMYNFARTTPITVLLIMALFVLTPYQTSLSASGIVIAIIAGGVTSGIGYAIWYLVLREISAIQAGVLQLSVPVISALGGTLFIGESITLRLIISSIIILGGISIVILDTKSRQRT